MVSTHWDELDHLPSRRQLRFLDLLARQAADLLEHRAAGEALRESERHAQTLLAELQHRVRNTLAVIRSIARRTAENSKSAEDMLAHFEGRLDAFSRVQAVLTRKPEARVDLQSLIDDELVAHAAGGGKVSISGPEVALDAKAAERLSLAIHELTTNAVKHGALSEDSGKIAIDWEMGRTGARDELILSWKESGLDMSGREISHSGFGMELLRQTLPYDLNAETAVALKPTGLCFELKLPLSELLDPHVDRT